MLVAINADGANEKILRIRSAWSVVLFAALSFLVAMPAIAQTALTGAIHQDDWTDPSGRFSLAFTALGWGVAPSRAQQMLTILSAETLRDNRIRMCIVTPRAYGQGVRGASQQDANERMNVAYQRMATAQTIPVSTTIVDGVLVTQLAATNQGFDIITRQFLLPEADGFSFVSVTCEAPTPMTNEERANMTAVLGSLRFRPS